MMTKAFVVTYLIVLSIGLTIGNVNDCISGPEYWCQSFEKAEDCGAIQHCTDTVWSTDEKYTNVESSATCRICQKLFEKTCEGLGDNDDLVKPNLLNTCNLLPSDHFQSKCTKIVEDYGTNIASLMKKHRFATICYLMNSCAQENSAPIVGRNRCTWGPSYWCSSLNNSRECQATVHCSNEIWSQQAIQKKDNDNICQYCEYIIDKLRSIIDDSKIETDVKKWLNDMCAVLESQDAVEQCKKLTSQYTDEILVLLENTIDSGVICHLVHMCTDVTLVSRNVQTIEQSKMLCNVIVRATYELYTNEKKSQNEINEYLKHDCQQLTTNELKENCNDIVEYHGDSIYENIDDNTMELSSICDETIFKPSSTAQCDQCQFVMSSARTMFDDKHSENDVLTYIDNEFCSKLNRNKQVNCRSVLETYHEILLNEIRQKREPILICTYFQLCFDEISKVSDDSDVETFFNRSFCDRLGRFKQSCHTLIIDGPNNAIKQLIKDLDGDDFCEIFGICSKQMPFLDDRSIADDKQKCTQCIDDFARRKSIGESLSNYSMQFLNYLCQQSSEQDRCLQSVDKFIVELRAFIRSFDPISICEELKICTQTLIETIQIIPIKNPLTNQLIDYALNKLCVQLGPLSKLCQYAVNKIDRTELNSMSNSFDPRQICSIIDICPMANAFHDCRDKCQCCVSKVEYHQAKFKEFFKGVIMTARDLCDRMQHSTECREMINEFENNPDEMLLNFNGKPICQTLTHCSETSDQCQICQINVGNRRENFRDILLELSATIQISCANDSCHVHIQSIYQTYIKQLNGIDLTSICRDFGECSSNERSISDVSNLLDICEKFHSLKNICQQLLTSKDDLYLYKTYKVFLNFNLEIIDNDFNDENNSTCDQCKMTVEKKKDQWLHLLNIVRNTLLQACDNCPSKDKCQSYVNQRFDNLTSYVKQIDPQQICQNLHLCSNLISIDNCLTCMERFSLHQQALLQGIDRLAEYITDYCQNNLNNDCQIYVKESKDSIEQIIMNAFQINDICTSIGFCDQSNAIDFDEYEQLLEYDIEQQICSIVGPLKILCQHVLHGNVEQISNLQINNEFSDNEQTKIDDQCKYCVQRVQKRKYQMKFIGDLLFRILIRSCHRQQCRRTLRFAKARFDARIHRICPYFVCQQFGYCNQTNATMKIISPIDRTNSTCILCQYVMNSLSNYIHMNSTEQEIEDNLEKICDQIPAILQNQCREYIDDYSPTIVSILVNDFNLTAICQKLNLCTKQMTINIDDIIKANTSTCGICQYLSTYIHFERQRQSNTNYLAKICLHLSDEYQIKCRTILQLFSPYINELELTPTNNFCQQLPICQMPMIDLKSAELTTNPLPKCSICQYVISYLDAALRNNKSQQAIEQALAKVCTILPNAEREQCKQLINTYGPIIAQLIADSTDPDTICRRIGLCEKSTPKSNSDKCIFGMKYWCTTRANAELCNAVDLCEREVWSKNRFVIN